MTRSYDIVTVTPLSLRADSRTLKQAYSVHRFGYRTMVVEGAPSGAAVAHLPFEVVASLEPPKPVAAPPAKPAPAPQTAAADAETRPDVASERIGWRRRAQNLWRKITTNPKEITLEYVLEILKVIAVATYYILKAGFVYIQIGIGRCIWFVRGVYNKVRYNNFNAFIKHTLIYMHKYGIKMFLKLPKSKLYYLHAPYQFPAVYMRCLLHRGKFIYDAHDFYSGMDKEGTISSFWRDWIIPFETFIERHCIRKASAVVTVNDSLVRLMKAKYGCDVLVLRNSHDGRLETATQRTIRDVIGLAPDAFLVVCVGQWKRDTAIPAAIEAFAGLGDRYHLAFLGHGFPSYEALLSQTGAQGRVHFVPAVQPGEVVPFIASANAGLLLYHAVSPSIAHSLPNGFFQPLAAGLPILYPELPEIGRLAASLGLGLPIDPLDPAAIRAQVLALGADAPSLAGFVQAVRDAGDVLSWERDEQRLKTVVESLIGPPAQRA